MTFLKYTGGQIEIKLTTRQKEVFELIKEKPAISRSQLASKLGINKSAVQNTLIRLEIKK